MSLAPVSGGPCHCKKDSLLTVKPVDDSTKTQYYLAIRIMIEKILVCSYTKHLEDDLVVLRNLKMGLGYRDIDCLSWSISRSSYSIIPNSCCFNGFLRIESHSVFDISIHFSHLHSQFLAHKILNQSFYDVG